MLRRTLAIVLLGGCAFVAAYVAFRLSPRPPATVAAAAATSATGTTAATGPTANTGPSALETAIPDTLPDARVPDLTGASKSLRDFLGHPLIVNFWATWCAPCRREMPLLRELKQRYQSQALEVLGVAVDSRPAVEQYLRERPVNYPILAGETEGTDAMTQFGAQPVLPFSIFADSQGRIVFVKLGELHPGEADYILTALQAVTHNQETVPQARTAIEAKLRELAIARAKASGSARPGAL